MIDCRDWRPDDGAALPWQHTMKELAWRCELLPKLLQLLLAGNLLKSGRELVARRDCDVLAVALLGNGT